MTKEEQGRYYQELNVLRAMGYPEKFLMLQLAAMNVNKSDYGEIFTEMLIDLLIW